ncbi:MAG: quinolinate synthase [Acidobacteria bacterium RIFCSPLOWO2_02_FULL_61_28]|nr:MAG: quinolinate synthase [Acidobacteria bacterium RIFCSPLOWO2_02_FULL_61_28]
MNTTIDRLTTEDLQERVRDRKRKKNAVILAHNYQLPEVQDIADFVGDSLGLSQAAARTDCPVIVFCGVHFMAETAAILCPDKKVLLPDLEAGCSLADTATAEQLRAWKAKHPGAVVVSYVNTTAEVKAESDYCCTSSNAVKIVQAIPPDREILFLPDMYLGAYVRSVTGRDVHLWLGECHVHAGIRPDTIAAMREAHPQAEMLVHPECGCTTSFLYYQACGDMPGKTYICSTEGMVRHVAQSPASEFIVATETGILHRMRQEAPLKTFYPAREEAVCQYMKKITLEKVLRSLEEEVYQVTVPPEIARKAKGAIDRMVAIT